MKFDERESETLPVIEVIPTQKPTFKGFDE